MNRLSAAKRAQILSELCKGLSMRRVSQLCDVSINTVANLLANAGDFCARFHDANVVGVEVRHIRYNQVWSFFDAKPRHVDPMRTNMQGKSNVWTWLAVEEDTNLIISYIVGNRNNHGLILIDDLRSRVAKRANLSGIKGRSEAPAGMLYRPSDNDDRFSDVDAGFSKKFKCHIWMVSIYVLHHNWLQKNCSLRATPAMAAGLTDKLMSWADIVSIMELRIPSKRTYSDKRTT